MNGAQTLTRAFDILFVLAEVGSSLSVDEIARRVAIPKSTTYRLLQTLEQKGIIERKAKGQISLGPKILDVARSLYQQMDRELIIIARPEMEQLTRKIEETSVLMIRTGLNIICIQKVESDRLIRFSIEEGRLLPLHRSASGKSILAFENTAIIEQVLSNIHDADEKTGLTEELIRVRQQGYSITIGEADKDVYGIGAPVYDVYQRISASLTIAGPVSRLQSKNYSALASEVMDAAERISQKLAAASKV